MVRIAALDSFVTKVGRHAPPPPGGRHRRRIVDSRRRRGLAPPAHAGPPDRWTQITRQHNGARPNLGLARDRDGTLHVLWAGPTLRPFTAVLDTPVSRSGAVGKPQPVVAD